LRGMDLERTLEFDKLKEIILSYALSDLGRVRVAELRPLDKLEEIKEQLTLCAEAKRVILAFGKLPLEGLSDVRPLLVRLRISGSILDPYDFLALLNLAEVNEKVRRFFKEVKSEIAPHLKKMASNLPNLSRIVHAISSRISPEGEILEGASPELRRIRRNMSRARDELQRRLEAILNSPHYQQAIQERIVTIRNNRYVIPIKQEFKGVIQGVVQGVSSSGATLFLEPISVVDLNNALHQLAAEEEREIRRILLELSDEMRGVVEDLSAAVEILGELDFINAKALFSIDYDCHEPEINTEGVLDLRRVRHPILEHSIRSRSGSNFGPLTPDRVVPIDVHIGYEFTTLVITGPNTGGKTVALKTIGLLSLMALSGLLIPAAERSKVALWSRIFADIGDEQSIEQNLSTFSSHISKIIEIIREADPNSLILLDELGAGTDPAEGAALGMAILDHLHSTGARTIATTHHSQLKVHAHNQPGMENASVEFDPQTLKPTYRLLVGVPGSSNALKIAQKLGMPQEILEKAKVYMGGEAVAVEEMLADMEQARRELERDRRMIAERLSEAEERAKRFEEMLDQIKREREEIIRSAEEEARRIISGARKTIERTVEEIRREQASKESIKRAHEAIENLRRSLQKDEVGERKSGIYTPGELVRIKSLDAAGKIVRVRDDKGKASIQVGGVELTVPISDIERLEPGEEVKLTSPQLLQIRLTKRASISPQINLIGCTTDEARRKLDKYLDDAFLAGLERVRVIHGRGTGALKKAVRDLLSDHPHVRSFRYGNPPEGGDGVTVVTLETD